MISKDQRASVDDDISMEKTFSSEFPKAQRLMLMLKKSLADLDRLTNPTTVQDQFSRSSIEKEMAPRVHVLSRNVQLLGMILERDSKSDPRAQQWRHRLNQLIAESDQIRLGFEKYLSKVNLEGNRSGFGSVRERLVGDSNELHRRTRGMDSALAEQDSLGRSLRNVDEMNEMGASVLKSLRDQRVYLKSAHRKALDFINVTGISRSLIGMIERRNVSDQRILIGGMILTLIVIVLTYYYFRG
jgi:hypothetical protein